MARQFRMLTRDVELHDLDYEDISEDESYSDTQTEFQERYADFKEKNQQLRILEPRLEELQEARRTESNPQVKADLTARYNVLRFQYRKVFAILNILHIFLHDTYIRHGPSMLNESWRPSSVEKWIRWRLSFRNSDLEHDLDTRIINTIMSVCYILDGSCVNDFETLRLYSSLIASSISVKMYQNSE